MSIAAVDAKHDVGYKLGYAKGYAAGRKRTEQEVASWETTMAESRRAYLERRNRIFCAALQATITSPNRWTMNGNAVTQQRQYIDLAKSIADDAMTVLED